MQYASRSAGKESSGCSCTDDQTDQHHGFDACEEVASGTFVETEHLLDVEDVEQPEGCEAGGEEREGGEDPAEGGNLPAHPPGLGIGGGRLFDVDRFGLRPGGPAFVSASYRISKPQGGQHYDQGRDSQD